MKWWTIYIGRPRTFNVNILHSTNYINVSCLFVDDSVMMLRGCQDEDSRHEWQKANGRAKRSPSPEKNHEEDGKEREQYLDRCSKSSLKEEVMQTFVCFFAKSLTQQM